MYQKFIDLIHRGLADAGEVDGYESKQLRYMIEAITSEVSKTIILTIVFAGFAQLQPYLFAVIALMLIRPFTGGLHFKTYKGCLAFTFVFFMTSVLLFNILTMSVIIYSAIALCAVTITWLIGPIQSKNRPKLKNDGIKRMQRFSTLLILTHYVLYLVFPDTGYLIMSGWVIMLQFIQLTIAKGVNNYDKTIQNPSETFM